MSKPIVMTRAGRGWTLSVHGSPVVNVGSAAKPELSFEGRKNFRPGAPTFVFKTKGQAEGVAHSIGHYMLKLGDMVFSYLDVRSDPMTRSSATRAFTVEHQWHGHPSEYEIVHAKTDSGANKAALHASMRQAARTGRGKPDRVIVHADAGTKAEHFNRLRGRRDPAMTARRAAVIRSAYTNYEAASKRHNEKKFMRGGSYTPEEMRAIARAAGLHKRPSNRAVEALSFHDFMTSPPDRVFAYYKKDARVGEAIILWDKQTIGTIVWRGVERRPMGGRTVAIRMAGKNGFLYSGSCNLSSGTYCRLKKGKPLSGRNDPRRRSGARRRR